MSFGVIRGLNILKKQLRITLIARILSARFMAKANFTYALKRFFPGIAETKVDPGTVKDVLAQLEGLYPGLSGYIVDDQGSVRQHVNVFVNGSLITDRKYLSDKVEEGDEVYFMQALSGG